MGWRETSILSIHIKAEFQRWNALVYLDIDYWTDTELYILFDFIYLITYSKFQTLNNFKERL